MEPASGRAFLEKLIQASSRAPSPAFLWSVQDLASRAKLGVQHLVQKVGFFGILACASVSLVPLVMKVRGRVPHTPPHLCLQIPNPLFDLAGITCGHFLVPFWTFFGATLIGKAIIKMHIQVGSVSSRGLLLSLQKPPRGSCWTLRE